MSSNRGAKKRLIQLYGEECFIEKLQLRQDDTPRHYTSKGQKHRMKQLTYHHIKEKKKGRKIDCRKWCFTISRKSCMV